MSWEVLVLSAFGGSFLTWVLSARRESRRMAETYRDPQRKAVGDIAAAKNDLVTAAALAQQALDAELNRGAWVRQPSGQIDQRQFASQMNDLRAAASGTIRVLDLGRIVVVDPVCRAALYNAELAMQEVTGFLSQSNPTNFVTAPLYAHDLIALVYNLEVHVEHLVDMAVVRLGPVLPWRVCFDMWAAAKIAEWQRLEEGEQYLR